MESQNTDQVVNGFADEAAESKRERSRQNSELVNDFMKEEEKKVFTQSESLDRHADFAKKSDFV